MDQQINYLNRTDNLEEKLKLAQERFNVIFQNTSVSIWDYVFETRQIIQPARSQELHGFDTVVENVPEGLIESGFIHPDSAQAFREMYDKMFAGEERVEGIFQVQTADRTGYWYEHIRYHVLFDENGNPYAAVGMSTDDTDEIVLQQKADSDALTGLFHKSAFKERMKSVFSRHPEQTHVLFSMDLDDFKQLNDSYGHGTGDELLRRVAGVIAEQVKDLPKTTYIARAGGDEFMILLCDTSANAAASIAQSLFACLKKPLMEGIYVHGSMGIAVFPKDGDTPERLELAADRALYSIKHQEKNDYCFYGDHQANHILQVQHRQQFLSDTVSGGMLGGYMEPGFPFYFVDKSLLSWLGYSSEDEYVADIKERLENGIHPDDREFVAGEIKYQLSLSSRYAVDYRMKKKDGSYIWIHGIGEKTTTMDGRQAITCVCYDISAEKEYNNLLSNLLEGLEAKVGLYRLEADGVLKLLHASKDIMEATHYSDAEYIEICKDDAIDFVYGPDREQVRKAIIQSVQDNRIITENFRLLDKRDGYAWVSGGISKLGNDPDLSAVRIVFMPLSLQNDLQIQMLDSNYVGVYVIDMETTELYYANEASLTMHGVTDREIVGKTCHEVFYGEKHACAHCWRNRGIIDGKVLHMRNGRDLSFDVQEKVWNNRRIAVVYSHDVTEETRLQKQQQDLFENIPAGIALLSIKNGVLSPIFCSSATEQILGVNPEKLMQEPDLERMFRFVHPDDLSRLLKQMQEDIQDGRSTAYYKYRCWNEQRREYLWIELRANTQKNGDETLVYATYNDMTRANQVQNELEKNREMMELAYSFSGLYIGTYNIRTRTIYLDELAQKKFGVKEKIENFPDCAAEYTKVLPAYLEEYKQKFEALCNGLKEVEYDFESYDTDGRPHWVRMKCHRITSSKEEPVVVVSTQLIDLEKSMMARLEQEREKLQSRGKDLLYYYVANLTRDQVIEYQDIFTNESVFPENMSIDECFKFFGSRISFSEDYDRVMKIHDRKHMLSCFEQGKCQEEYDSQLTMPDGAILFMNGKISMLSDPVTGDVLLYEYVYDTSSEQIMTNMLKLNMDYGYELIGHWITKNDQFTFMEMDSQTGHSTLKRIGFSEYARTYALTSVIPEDRESYSRYYSQLASQQTSKKQELMYRTMSPEGHIRYHKATAVIYDKEKRIYLLTKRDYTDVIQKEAEKNKRLTDALEQAKQANDAKSDFMARMSHDMRTPMNAILGMTHLAAEENNNPQIAEYMKQIEESSRYLLGIINDILEMGRIESGKTVLNYEWCTWKEILEPVLHMIEPMMEQKGIIFEYNKKALERFPIEFYVDKQKSQQMLMNILNNACKFTEAGGTIRLKFRNLTLDREHCTCADQIIIEDTGCGMSEEFLKHIFEPFSLERLPGMEGIPGTGLGLPISRNIARQMGGDITVESQVNQGSVFTITYPYRYRYLSKQDETQKCDGKTGIEETEIFVGKRILLVEDNEINAMIAMKILEKKGMQVVTACNGKEALDLFAQEPDGSFHLILMDIRMPVMDGLTAARQIRSLEKADARSIPIIAMSANAYEEDRQLSLNAGMNAHLSKPVEPEKLYHTIQKYLIMGGRI